MGNYLELVERVVMEDVWGEWNTFLVQIYDTQSLSHSFSIEQNNGKENSIEYH